MQPETFRTSVPFRTALLSAALAVAACAGQVGADDQQNLGYHAPVRGMTMKHDPGQIESASAPAGAHLTYNGGRINSAPKVYVVLWGTGSYESHVSSSATPSMLSFYNQVVGNGSWSSWLNGEYNTVNNSYNGTKTNQNIGNGSSVSVITITPASSSATISDATIQTELSRQIANGTLPAPTLDSQGNNTTYYAVFFPHGKTITQGGSNSCQAGGFCAYHGTVAASGSVPEYYYGVHPDMQSGSGCDTGCGNASTAFGNYTSVASHELTEMETDAEVGLAGNGNGPPLAWYDNTNGEIGDICNASQANYTACDGQTYVLQQEFSNAQNNCINVPSPTSCGTTTPDFSISASSATIAAGASGSSNVTTSTIGSSGTITLALSGVPSGITATLGASSVASGAGTTISITVASTTAAGSYSFTVTGTEGSKTHAASVAVTVTTSGGGGGGGTIFSDGFESGNWTSAAVSGSATWSSVTSSSYPSITAHGGTHWADFNSYTAASGASARFSHTGTIALPSGSTNTLTFWVYHDTGYSTDADKVQAQVSTNGSTWTSVGTAVNRYNGSTGWAQATVDISSYAGQTIYLALLGTSAYGNDVYVDDVAITSSGGGGGGGSTYAISGTITSSGAGLAGVTVSTTGASGTTSSTGAYSLANLANGTYTVTPSLSGYTFSPASQSVTVSGANVSGVNFTATSSGGGGGGTLLTDGFEAAGWTATQVAGTGGAWAIVTSSKYPSISAHGGSHWADFNSYTSASGSQTRYARTTTVVIPSTVTTVTMTYWMYHDTGYSTDADKVQPQVGVSSAWTSVGSANNRYNGSTGWAQATVDLSAYKGKTIQIGFLGTSAYGNDIYLDDVSITAQ